MASRNATGTTEHASDLGLLLVGAACAVALLLLAAVLRGPAPQPPYATISAASQAYPAGADTIRAEPARR